MISLESCCVRICLSFGGQEKGAMWPTAFALKELTASEEARIAALVKKAVR